MLLSGFDFESWEWKVLVHWRTSMAVLLVSLCVVVGAEVCVSVCVCEHTHMYVCKHHKPLSQHVV